MNGVYAFRKRSVDRDFTMYHREAFEELIRRETVRSLRSQRPFLFMVIDCSGCGSDKEPRILAQQIASVLSSSTRETDVKGWYAEGAVLGILFTEFGSMRDSVDAAEGVIVGRLYEKFFRTLSVKDVLRVRIMSWPSAKPAVFQYPRNDDMFSLPLFPSMESTSAYNQDVEGVQLERGPSETALPFRFEHFGNP
jgi:hypothetical protein